VRGKRAIVLGIGVGLIIAAAVFFGFLMLSGYNHPEKNFENIYISDEEIIRRAESLGMIFISDYLNQENTDVQEENLSDEVLPNAIDGSTIDDNKTDTEIQTN